MVRSSLSSSAKDVSGGGEAESMHHFACPLVVRLSRHYAASGNGVVSNRTMLKVGFNGLQFRGLNACPELQKENDPLVQEAWPPGLLRVQANHSSS